MYKTLFELRILHQYYLTGKDGRSVLDNSDIAGEQGKRMRILGERFSARIPSISDELSFSFAEDFRSEYRKYDIRLLPVYSGFKVLAAVKPVPQTDGAVLYKPVKDIPQGLPFVVEIARKSPLIDSITNSRLSHNLPANYFFTNLDPRENKRLPVLSEIASPYNSGHGYEQGELYSSGNSLFAVYFDKNGTENQFPVAGLAYVNENDRITVNPRFTYAFRDSDKIVDYSFILKDDAGQTLQTISRTTNNPVKNVTLDFSQVISTNISGRLKPHQLEVRGTDNYRRIYKVNFIGSHDTGSVVWGWTSIYQQSGSSNFNLFDQSGFLITRLHNDKTEVSPQVFEIWLNSRLTFWRYKNSKGEKLKKKDELEVFFDYDDGIYASKTLRGASYVPTEFKTGTGSRFFPNPASHFSITRESKRLFTDILVPHSPIFEPDESL